MHKVIRVATLIVGFLLSANAAIMFMTTNFNLGLLAEGGLGAFLILYGIFLKKLRGKKYLHILFSLGIAGVLCFCTFLAAYGNNDNADFTEKTVIVLGCGISGEEVGDSLARRLDKAIAYHENNPDAVIIVSGGQGPEEAIPEALAMKRYLIKNGIDEGKIIMEDKSTSTITNLAFSHEKMRERSLPDDTVVLVTNSYHIYRAVSYAKAEGLSVKHLGADIPLSTAPMSYLREILAVAKMWVFD